MIGKNFKIIKKEYLDYLRSFDSKVPENDYETNKKFFLGVVIDNNEHKYFVPISSYKDPNNIDFLIKRPDGSILSSARIRFMIPIPNDSVLIDLDLSMSDEKYINLVDIEEKYCVQNYESLCKKANKIYRKVQEGTPYYRYKCCDYKNLETACDSFDL